MRKLTSIILALLLVVSFASVSSAAQAKVYTLLNAATATGDGSAQELYYPMNKFTCSVVWGGTHTF